MRPARTRHRSRRSTPFWTRGSAINDGYDPARAQCHRPPPPRREAETVVGFDANLVLLSHLHTHAEPGEKPPVFEGSTDGDFTKEDRVTLVRGASGRPGTTR